MPHGFGHWVGTIFVWALAYLIGSLPFGVWVSRALGKDLRKEGSGNVGAANAMRVLGIGWGSLVLVLDILKGVVAMLFAGWIIGEGATYAYVIAATLVVAGHVWSCVLDFKGGKGIATMFGVLLVINWGVAVLTLIVWIVVVLRTRYVSVASLGAVVAAGLLLGMCEVADSYVAWATVMLLLALWTHRENLQRLVRGVERTAF